MKHMQLESEHASAKALEDEQLVGLARCTISTSRLRAWSKHLQVHCRDGRMTLTGNLPSFYLKQVLQTIVGNLPGVQGIDNAVEVRPAVAEAMERQDRTGPSP